jgi:Family of unknown function (DUF6502)
MERSPTRTRLLQACHAFFVPVARLLLRSGVSFTEFAEIARAAFVEVASNDYGIRGRRTNVSRVSAMTGIARKEVRRLRQIANQYMSNPRVELSPLSDVLHKWFTDSAYLARDGRPKKLLYSGDQISFTTLVRECAGDLPVGAIRVELIRVGAVAVDETGHLVAKRRYVVPEVLDDRVVTSIVFGLRALASTVAFNCSDPPKELGRIERFVESNPLESDHVGEIRAQLRTRIAEFTEEVDDFFSKVEESPDRSGKRVGVGVFFYEDD